jgi:hypothetical protein
MAIISTLTAALALTPFIAGAAAHTHEQIKREVAFRPHVAALAKRGLERCSGSAAGVALKKRAAERRAAKAQAIREKRGLQSRT